MDWPILVSSANLLMQEIRDAQLSISSMYIINKRGPSTDPCGTPDATADQLLCRPLSTVRCRQSVSQLLIHERTVPSMPHDLSLARRRSCGTLSNAFAKSRYMISVGVPLSRSYW